MATAFFPFPPFPIPFLKKPFCDCFAVHLDLITSRRRSFVQHVLVVVLRIQAPKKPNGDQEFDRRSVKPFSGQVENHAKIPRIKLTIIHKAIAPAKKPNQIKTAWVTSIFMVIFFHFPKFQREANVANAVAGLRFWVWSFPQPADFSTVLFPDAVAPGAFDCDFHREKITKFPLLSIIISW